MVSWYGRLLSVIAVMVALLGAGTVAHAVGDEEAVLVPGAMPFKAINPFYPVLKNTLYPDIGIHFRDDDDGELVDYSQNPLASDRAIRQGVERTIAAVRDIDGEVVVIGESMGSMVASRVAVELANSSDPPAVGDIRFVLIAPPEAGAAEFFTEGTFIPFLNYRVSRVPESPYLTTIVIGEYDGWSDPPDRPWNLVSLLNSALGALAYVHGQTSLADPADVAPENITVEQNSLGATVTTYFVPTENLPLTQVFRLVVPDALVDLLDGVLRPIVDAGYRRHDQPGDVRPYLSDGRIQWPQQETLTGAVDLAPVAPTGAASTSGDETGVATPGTSEESGGGSPSSLVNAASPAGEAADGPDAVDEVSEEPESADQDDSGEIADPVDDVLETDEPEMEPESGTEESGSATEQDSIATPDGPGSVGQNDEAADNTADDADPGRA